jgi:hypothetical protein
MQHKPVRTRADVDAQGFAITAFRDAIADSMPRHGTQERSNRNSRAPTRKASEAWLGKAQDHAILLNGRLSAMARNLGDAMLQLFL